MLNRRTRGMNANSTDKNVWIISGDHLLVRRITESGQLAEDEILVMEPGDLDDETFTNLRCTEPGIIVLDVTNKVDWGLWAIRAIKRARIKAPIVVFTNNFSREFGAKIVSEGVRYYFGNDFSASEFREVMESLLKNKRPLA
jgi:DNA-binding NarL/FixJ family response regulator